MEKKQSIEVMKNFTVLDDEIYLHAYSNKIKIADVVVYSAIKSQNDGKYGSTISDISRVYNISKSQTHSSVTRLEGCGMIETKTVNNSVVCKYKKLDSGVSNRIPKAILMSKDICINSKAFLLVMWHKIIDEDFPEKRSEIQDKYFSKFGIGITWVSSKVDELILKGVLRVVKGNISVDNSRVIEICESVIEESLKQNENLENIVVRYEEKTGIPRESMLKADTPVVKPNEKFQCVIDAIQKGNKDLGRDKDICFSRSDLSIIQSNLKNIIECSDQDEESTIQKVVKSLEWKSEMALRDKNQKKYYSLQFFTRKNKNNLSSNLYHYSEYLKKHPLYKKIPVVSKKISTVESNDFVEHKNESLRLAEDLDW